MPKSCLPEHLKNERHRDWPWPFKYIPRAWNAFCGKGPADIRGWKDPIPLPGMYRWHLWDMEGSFRPYFAYTFQSGLHFRTGFRWDDVDGYYNLVFPFTFRRLEF
jgi:hypothetical protein